MNPHSSPPVSPYSMAAGIFRHRSLIYNLSKREVIGRYKGSVLGLLWSFLNPLLMLLVYTFFFSVVFKTRWGTGEESKAQFAVVLFSGMIVHTLFSEVMLRAPGLIPGNANYVKKVVFPLEILVPVAVCASIFHAFASVVMLLGVFVALNGFLHWTIIFLPLIVAPLMVLSMGVGWIFASLGVFARDLGQVVTVLSSVLLFLSPVFYAASSLPASLKKVIFLNPLTFVIEDVRAVLIWGRMPNWTGLCIYSLFAALVAWLGYVWFQKTRRGFADVL